MRHSRRRRSPKSKAKAQINHACKRLGQRYDIFADTKTIEAMVKYIQDGNAEFIEKQSNRVSVFKVTWADKDIKVVYDKMRKTIVTALPWGENNAYRL